jgi:hypothetical protein
MPRLRTLPRTFPLSEKDWTEIWNCSEENIQNKLPIDGLRTTAAMQRRLSEKEWIQIFLSIETKRDALTAGFYGRDAITRAWRTHTTHILSILAPVRDHFIGTAPRTTANSPRALQQDNSQ